MDIAELGYKVDSSGLVEGTKALDENAAAADKAGAAADRLEKSQKGTGKSASYWANEQAKINARVLEMERIEQRAAVATRQAATATEAHELNLQKLLGQINPTVAALNKLAEQEDRLARARDLGLLKPQVWQQYQSQLEGTRAGVLATSNTFGKLNLQAVETQQSLAMLMRALATGNFAQAQSSIASLTARTGVLSTVFSGAGLAVAGFTAVVVAGIAAWKQGNDELFGFQKNLILTGRSADITFGQLQRMVDQLDRIPGVSRSGALDSLNAVAKSGQFVGQQFDLVSASAARMEASLGVSADKTVASFAKIVDDPVQGLLELNKQYRFLTQAQIDYVYQLQQQGDEVGAVTEALRLADDATKNLANTAEANLPALTEYWRDMKGDVSGTWSAIVNVTNAIADLGREYGVLARLPSLSDILGFGLVGGVVAKNLPEQFRPPSFADLMNRAASRLRNPNGLPTNIEGIGEPNGHVADPNDAKKASDQWNRRLEMYDKQLKMGAEVERIEAEGIAAGRTRAEIEATIANYMKSQEESAKRTTGTGKTARSGVEQLLARVQQQISANDELARSGQKVSQSQRLIEEIDIRLADGKGTLTHAERRLLETERERLAMSHDIATVAQQNERDMVARAALTERLLQLESQRREQARIDLIGLGQGREAAQVLQRELEIKRQYFAEQEKLDKAQRNPNTALSKAEYEQQTADLIAAKDRDLGIEKEFQQYRMNMLSDWRTGFRQAWADYAFAASNALEQANGLMNTALSGWEDAWVRFAQTGKLSFRDMANAIIADLARIAAKQAAVGIINAVAGAWGGGVTAAGNAAATSGTQSINAGLLDSYGGGRATGGPVAADSFYQVGEGGKPELFRQNGRTYLIPGDNGAVIPAAPTAGTGSASTGSGSVVNVRVVVNSDGSTDVSAETPVWQRFGKEIGQLIDMKINEAQVRSMKDGGAMRVMGAGR
ncbi:phage tail tape measure protein [Mesorhizobium sp. M00.F.Ca.ET.151.01.1.1]|nr:phage tail tape measure protein [bacterium M00.F.Ca.ET.199.01.1.1]TGT08771.1 phage tail tape measure protein [bacterium M00.F.Ca.ET.177.01.1.1]TGT66705.1 phage tail tape measure protein [Mesorhizobium sp. M00.F.Ca.ET.170.01.1.1]TGU15618.1 phage tail tape measure protein [bacterium M00.F.Ca.ET.163.01.1.1]TGU98344.1 phage tail tape measure protein [Mesorhizobium sp. M00.F.Ca.ET.151.01.1.1]TGV60010.1 phage tail tape measure protein [bacterium M00.F.Ca.ET.141.01.1.1]